MVLKQHSLLERFLSKLIRTKNDGSCWVWTGAKDKDGYGRFWYEGRVRRAHIMSFQLYNGEIPEGKCVLHECDNPACVNPSHLFLGSQGENIEDRDRKERQARGEKNGRALFTEEKVNSLRSEYVFRSKTHGVKALARREGVSRSAMGKLLSGKTYE